MVGSKKVILPHSDSVSGTLSISLLPQYLSFLCIGVGRSVEADLDGAVADLVLVHDGHGALGVPLVDEADEAGAPLLHLGVLDLPAVAAN